MKNIHRRDFLRAVGGIGLLGTTMGFPSLVLGAPRRVVVVGGGVGGCTAAKYLLKLDPSLSVTLIESHSTYTSCFMSNEVISGDRTLQSLTFTYDGLRRRGVNVVQDTVVGIDSVQKTVHTAGGHVFDYDACVVSPGIGFKWNEIEGYDEQASEIVPHAWNAGPQTTLLQKQLQAMRPGGTVIVTSPPNPFKCPPGPYERASQIAMYCKRHNPRAKVIILDAKFAFSKQGLYEEGWSKLYGLGTSNSMIEWVSGAMGGNVEAVDPRSRTLQCEFDEYKADVLNIIPPQKAGPLAFAADLTEGDWCPVDLRTFESSLHKDIYVLGDAASSSPMPKSAYIANSQAKVAAAAITARFAGHEPGDPSYLNTCYSILGDDFGISVAAVYNYNPATKALEELPGSGGLSPLNASTELRKREVSYAHSWFENVISDMLE